jgi:hypothetical protein
MCRLSRGPESDASTYNDAHRLKCVWTPLRMVRRACELDDNSCQTGPALAFKNEVLSDLTGFASVTHPAERLGRSTRRGGGGR